MKRLPGGTILVLVTMLGVSVASAEPLLEVVIGRPISEIVVFGDSLSDTGNVWWLTGQLNPAAPYPPSPPYFEGRFSNGPVWVEHIAARYDLPAPAPAASGAGGSNYAFGGAESDPDGVSGSLTPNIGTQISQYLAAGNTLDGDELIVLWGGANDFFGGQTDASIPAANIAQHVSNLVAAGGRELLVPNLPPLGKTPAYRGTADEAVLDALAVAFNTALAARLAPWESDPDVTVHQLDIYGGFLDMLADPGGYGLENVTDRAIDAPPGTDADTYLFWDDVHPTTAAHAMIADRVHVIPEPSSLVLLAIAGIVLGMAAVRRGRKLAGGGPTQ